ncbi:ABC transporter permease [Arthrobacter sp. NPDC090010]|uniref:ABC transporter permease n=1 Tax=Arthrobacter sp. NPDC090010 TaxID=3363942 RepID=UPI0038115E64
MSQATLRTAHPTILSARVRGVSLTERLGPLGLAAAAALTVLVLLAVLAPLIAPFDPDEPDLLNVLADPGGAHLLGTDALGRDILSRLLWGARLTLAGPGLVILVSTVVGAAIALVAAWFGGTVDMVLSWILDILFAVPGIVFALIAVAIFGPSFSTVIGGLVIAYIPYVARVVRGAALRERSLPYVSAAWLQGQRGSSIMLRQLLPNLRSLIIAQSVSSLGFAVIDLAAVSFLGLGVQPPTADLGLMVKSGFDSVLRGFFTEAATAGTLIVLIVLCVTVIGDRLNASARSTR